MKIYEMQIHRNRKKIKKNAKKRRALLGVLVLCGLAFLLLLFLLARLIFGGGDEGESLFENILGGKSGPPYVVALDAGHGGGDVGAIGIIQEIEMTETTVRYLYDMLEASENFTPVLCREYGEGATPAQRAKVATKAKADLLISIHGNSDYGEGSYGFECYPAPPGRKWHEESMRFASLAAGEMAAAGSRLRGENGVRFVYYEEGADGSDVKVFREASEEQEYDNPSFGVVDKPNCPAVLMEQCFVTSASDLARFGGEEGGRYAAECYYRAICAYFEVA